jgi:hypothetical protein
MNLDLIISVMVGNAIIWSLMKLRMMAQSAGIVIFVILNLVNPDFSMILYHLELR